eukprot:403363401
MSVQDYHNLIEIICKYRLIFISFIVSYLGSEVQFIGNLVQRNQPINFMDLLELAQNNIKDNQSFANVDLRNILAVMIKHNILLASLSEFDKITYYSIDEKECILRLSMPKYLTQIRQMHGNLHALIMEEIFINGSLNKSEIIPLILENHQLKITEQEILRSIEELTLKNLIVGAKSYDLMDKNLMNDINEKDINKAKKMSKRSMKMQEDEFQVENLVMQQLMQQMEFPLKINTQRLLAEERRQCVLEMAEQKFNQNSEQEIDFKVFLAMATKCENVQQLVTKDELTFQREQKSFTSLDVIQILEEREKKIYQEKDINASLDRIFSNQDQFILKVNFDTKKQLPVFVINWKHIFQNFKQQLMFQIVEETMSKYHARVMRILHSKGFLEEKDITQYCLLPLKNTRSLINQLLNEGYVKFQELQVKQQGLMILYGINHEAWQQGLSFKLAKCNLNILIKEKTLNIRSFIAAELNHLLL